MLHLFHPALVHFAVAFLIVGGATEAIGILARREAAERFGGALTLVGTGALLPTIVAGYLAENTLSPPPAAVATLEAHERVALVLLATFLIALLWKAWDRGRVREELRPFYAAWLLFGVGLTAAAAFLGGELVYLHGLGVG